MRGLGSLGAALTLGGFCALSAVGLWRANAARRALLAVVPAPAAAPGRPIVTPFETPVFFYLPGCSECERTEPLVEAVEDEQFRFVRLDVSDPEGDALLGRFEGAYHLPAKDAGRVPIVFLGDRALVGVDGVKEGLRATVARWRNGAAHGVPSTPTAERRTPRAASEGHTAPMGLGPNAAAGIALYRPAGHRHTLADLHGRAGLLIFLCGCDACRRFTNAWRRQQIPAGVTAWGVSGDRRLAASLFPDGRAAFPIMYDPGQALHRAMGTRRCPDVHLVDAAGRTIWQDDRGSPEQLANAVATHLKANAYKETM